MTATCETVYDYFPLRYEEPRAFADTYGFAGSQGYVHIDAVLMRPKGRPSSTVMIFMHPSVAQHILPVPKALAAEGMHVLCAQNRYFKNDSALIFEKALLDLGAIVRHAKETLGYKKVVLVGWSGGGPLITFYQSQAENPTITHTPAGDPVNIKGADLIPADGVIFQAASVSRAQILAEYIDPSVVDELNPDKRDATLDLYDPENPNKSPFSAEYVARYREAQLSRMRRITSWVQEEISELKRRGGASLERGFCVHRTMADLRWFDLAVDPNERKYGVSFLGNPESANNGPVGFARFCTLRSWLSQWSIDDSQANAVECVKHITVPLLVIENGADDGAPAAHVRAVFDAAISSTKQMKVIPGANHYYAGQPELMAMANATTWRWLEEHRLME